MIDVSVIVPTFNRKQHISVALNSIFGQRDVVTECIVVDDCSTDGTVSFIRERYSDRPLVVIEKALRSGPQASRNLGMAAARGDFVTFLDSDDYLEPNTLAKRVRLCREKCLDALFTGYCIKFVGRQWNLVKNVRSVPCPSYADALRDFKITQTSAIMYRRSTYPELQLDEDLASGHDDDLSLFLIRAGNYAFADIFAATIIQHVGERVATPRNLMIGDAQLLKKYSKDIRKFHGKSYLTRRRAHALAGLWSVGQFRRSAFLRNDDWTQGGLALVGTLAILYFPLRLLAKLRRRATMIAVRKVL